jgi:RNA polymerase sigma factor (sigma-70 family)
LLQHFLSQRDESAFAALVERHGPMVLGICRSVLRDAHDAEDVCQATFLVLARKASSIRRPASLASFLHGVAYRLALKARSAARRAPGRPPDRPAPGPMDELTWRELRQALHDELQALPERYRLPLVLCYLEGKTMADAGRLLRCPTGTVKGRLARARDLLRQRLRRRGLLCAAGLPLRPAGTRAPSQCPRNGDRDWYSPARTWRTGAYGCRRKCQRATGEPRGGCRQADG